MAIILGALIAHACMWVCTAGVNAGVEWKVEKQLRLKETPLSLVASADGRYVYILAQGKLLIYSLMEGKGKYTIPVDTSLDMITLSEATKMLILTSKAEKLVQIISLAFIPSFDISGLAFLGLENAPVTITTFIDYQ